jgi:hypothetical protein
MFKKHNEKSIILDIIGTYFVDCFYNSLYIRANEIFKAGKATSLTDMYKYNIREYMRGIQDKNITHKVIKQLHDYYQKAIGVGFIQFSEFEDKFLSEFIPPEYYTDFDTVNKDKILFDIVVKTINIFGKELLDKNNIKRIIDDHYNVNNIPVLQESILNIFLDQRDEYYLKFVKENIKPQSQTKYDTKMMNGLKREYMNEKKAKLGLENDKVRLLNIVKQLNEKMIEMETKIVNYEKENNELKKENNELKNELNEIKKAKNTVLFSREPERYSYEKNTKDTFKKDNLKMNSAMKDVYPTKEHNLYQQEVEKQEKQEKEKQEKEKQEKERREKQEKERQERERYEKERREKQERERQEKEMEKQMAKSFEKKEAPKIRPEDEYDSGDEDNYEVEKIKEAEKIKEDNYEVEKIKEGNKKPNVWNDNDIMNWNAEEEIKISEDEIKEHHIKKRMINTDFFKQKNVSSSNEDDFD